MSERPLLVAQLKPNVVFAIPVDQRAGCLALTDEKRVTAEMWDTTLSFLDGAAFGINLPRIHPLEVITAIADCVSRSDNRHLVGRTSDDRNSELSGRTLLHQDRNISLAIANEIAAQIEWIYAKGELVLLRQQTIRDGSADYLRNVIQMCGCVRRCRFRGIGLGYRFRF